MAAQLVIDDGGGPVVGSVEEDNSYLGATFDISNFDDTNNLAWIWELADKPLGSSASLINPTPSTARLVPDIAGSYLVRLKTYSDAGATVINGADEQVIGIRFPVPFDWRIPAAGETTQLDAARGWATPREIAIRDTQSFMNSGLPQLTGVVNELLTDADPETVLGGFLLSGSDFPVLTIKLRLIGLLSLAGAGTGDLRLYDLGPATGPAVPGVLRATATIPNGSAGSVVMVETSLTSTATPGVNVGEIYSTRRLYELRAQLVGGSPGDTFKIHNGAVTVEG